MVVMDGNSHFCARCSFKDSRSKDEWTVAKFKDKLESEGEVAGSFMKTSDSAFVEVPGCAGFGFGILDIQHGPCSFETVQNCVRAALVFGTVPILRRGYRNKEY